jgi:hypothetical protein
MKKLFSLLVLFPFLSLGQSLFSNPITETNPNFFNPYTNGQIVDLNISVSGISRGSGILGKNANNRYNATGWNSVNLDPTDYFEFILTPSSGKKIDFVSFVYTGQRSGKGPVNFAFRSSADGFTADIGTVVATGSTVSLLAAAFQNSTTAITFRIYGWGADAGTGTFSVNDFVFNGIIGCAIPEVPHLADVVTSCASTSFALGWNACLNAAEYSLDVATDASFVNAVSGYVDMSLGDVTTQNVTGLLAGKTYYVRLLAKNDCGDSDYSNTIQVSPPSTTYKEGLWSNGTPDGTKTAILSSNYVLSTDTEACSCTIDSGVLVGVNSGVILKLLNGLDVVGNGSLVFENSASLVQVNDLAVNTGAIVYKRDSTPMKNFDYTYWSSPVAGQKLNVLSPNTLWDKYFSFANNNWVIEAGGNTMAVGEGYIIRVPKPEFWPNPMAATYIQSVQFEGIPNNGVQSLAIGTTDGDGNLIGNPYPSAMSADVFLLANKEELDGTIYFWTHNTAISNLMYSSADYASYNGVGGVATSGGVAPDGAIAAGQSFFTTTKSGSGFTGFVAFNNGMRVEAPDKNAQFFKGSKPKNSAKVKHRIWLNLTNENGAFKQTLVGYVAGATLGNDAAFDGESFDGNTYIDFYSINENKNLVIQGRALPFDKTDKVPLGYKTTIEGTFEISIDKVDGVLANQTVFIEDKVANVIHNLKNGAYSFSTLKGVFNDRFVLRYIDKSVVMTNPTIICPIVTPIVTIPVVVKPIVLYPILGGGTILGAVSFDNKEKSVLVSVENRQITINSLNGTIAKVMIYDLSGKLLYQNEQVNKNECVISNMDSVKKIVVVVTELSNGTRQSNGIVF